MILVCKAQASRGQARIGYEEASPQFDGMPPKTVMPPAGEGGIIAGREVKVSVVDLVGQLHAAKIPPDIVRCGTSRCGSRAGCVTRVP